ncbi:putative polysaccharide deacetylase family protein [Aspergillus mulundensis]|uniref:Putative polysaccharide deacetylase family protein n=1 Tax=Aspergillus mulundensis TaxID=1810919 RepID=A0A3D8QNJ3_9EURO|nr:putative polysaccharide deacetylase family protein [Aspergillus mulundensis]RDW63210.1 putative polysaccharide deacetylase family protein [Aspergillus mulundensis]
MTPTSTSRPRDFIGYGDNAPKFTWPGGKKVAINFAINYEEGTERNPLLGDSCRDSRTWVRSALPETERDLMQEAEYEYGTRVGIWRLLRIFREFDAPYSVFLSSEALAVNPALAERFRTENCDMVSHGTRSISRVGLSEDEERSDLRRCMQQTFKLTGKRIHGAFPRPPITESTRRIMAEEGLLYDSATTNDDRPYFAAVGGRPMLVLPYAVDTNDARFWGGQSGPGYTGSTDFFAYLKDAFDVLHRDAEVSGSATMMSIGLHARIMRAGRVAALVRFLEYVRGVPGAWVAKREDIAGHFVGLFAPGDAWNVDALDV